MSEIRAGRAYVEVYTKDATAAGQAGIRARLGAFAGQLARIGTVAMGVGLSAATAAGAVVMKAVNAGSAIKDMADRTGLSTDAVQELGYAARQSGTDVQHVETGIKQMQKSIAANAEVFADLGLNAEALAKLKPDEQFQKVADAIYYLEGDATRTAAAMKVFGRSGTDLIPMFKDLGAQRERARRLGIIMPEDQVFDAEALGDKLQDMNDQFKAFAITIGSALLPLAEQLADTFAKMGPAMSEWARGMQAAGDEGYIETEIRGRRWATTHLVEWIARNITGNEELADKMAASRKELDAENAQILNAAADAREKAREERRQRATDLRATAEDEASKKRTPMGSFDIRQFDGLLPADILTEQRDILKRIEENTAVRQAAVAGALAVGP